MKYFLENDLLKVTLDTFGAEIKSVLNKTSGREYIWCGDPAIWGRTAPVLFPFIGNLKDKSFRFEGREYSMPTQHGFARDKEHTVLSCSENEIWFSLKDSAENYENYPFHFELKCGYRLEGNTLSVLWEITNPGQDREDQTLYFSIGAHPAFTCPLYGEENKAGYALFFEGLDEVKHHGNLTGTCTHEDLTLSLTNNRAIITPEFFDRSTYIVEGKQTGCVGLEDPNGHRYITVKFDTPLFAVWSPERKNAPFVCIEPWYGRADYDDFDGDLTEREYGNSISPNEKFGNVYTITFD